MKLIKFFTILFTLLFSASLSADELKIDNNTKFNIYTGMFDFSDDGKRATLIGFQHLNENLNW